MSTVPVENIRHAAEIMLAISEGKKLTEFEGADEKSRLHFIFTNCILGQRYKVVSTDVGTEPRTRPFTFEEAKRLVGTRLLNPDNRDDGGVLYVRVDGSVVSSRHRSPTLEELHKERWHYLVDGDANPKECWVTERDS